MSYLILYLLKKKPLY